MDKETIDKKIEELDNKIELYKVQLSRFQGARAQLSELLTELNEKDNKDTNKKLKKNE